MALSRNDWGSHISSELGRVDPDAVVVVHVTQLFSFPEGKWLSYPPSVEPDLGQLTLDDRAALNGLRHLQPYEGSYAHVHGQKPHIPGFALSDSPIGLLASNSDYAARQHGTEGRIPVFVLEPVAPSTAGDDDTDG